MNELRIIAETVAAAAAEQAARLRVAGVEVAGVKSSQTDVVTLADQQTETWIRDELARLRPRDGILGEEGNSVTGTSGITWIVDPIDGTVNYLYAIPQWAVSIAAVEGDPDPATWTALAGAVANPGPGEVYAAVRGEGAYLGEHRLELEPKHDLGRALVATGFGYAAKRRAAQARMLTAVLPRVRDIRRMGAASLDLCAVATGRVDAYYEVGLKPWDHAAGVLVAREAGAILGGPGGAGTPPLEAFAWACNPGLAEPFADLLTAARADIPEADW
ncbi:inositol monophosphatase family protein [Granulicoccus phenolivorans]|uniref:inositol monophosphatase family protein n=1 Tax=Granulicoccus phenolivorans TaxID=266854 RepID=UPI0004296B33|nr:inositol monophosphatase family protein [Granulicoccus phenolivorans]